ncbi:MAG: GHKL domain-containing protein [Flavobacteriales bacterium]|nr:GHKL domain-containing protein [Flavobacteriales bacterium]
MKTLLAFLLLPCMVTGADGTDSWPLREGLLGEHLGERLEVFHDSTRALSVQDVLARGTFNPLGTPVPNLGLTGDAVWLRTRVRNSTELERFHLCIDYADLDRVSVFVVYDGVPVPAGSKGQSVPLLERSGHDPEFVFPVRIAPGSEAVLLIRLESTKQIQLPVLLRSADELIAVRSGRNLTIGIYAGVMLVLALYNLFLLLSIRDRSYLFYVLYLVAVLATQLAFLGVGPFYLWAGNTWWSSNSTLILTLVTATLGMEFARNFIDTRRFAPGLHRISVVFYLVFALCIAAQQSGLPRVAYQAAQALSGLSAIFTLSMAVVALRRGSRQAFFFLLAWAVFLSAVVVFVLKDVGILPYNELTIHAMPVGSAIEGVLLSFGLADRINILRREKERSQAEALSMAQENERIIREQNVMLESKVQERTKALQESNDHLKRTQSQLVNAEKMASLGQLTAGIAHEINNPVNFITSNIPPLRRDLADVLEVLNRYRTLEPDQAASTLAALREREAELDIDGSIHELGDILRSIEEGAGRTAEIVRGLRNFSRLDEDDLKLADLNEGLQSTLTVLANQLKDHADLHLELGELPAVECHPGKLNQVFMNILNNAIQAIASRKDLQRGTITVRSAVVGDAVRISIADDGPGMTETVMAKIFEPFFTTKEVGEGTGLGLSIAYSIVEKHGGRITVESLPGAGATFHVTLPKRQQRAHQEQQQQRA